MRLSDTLRELPGQQEWPSLSKTQKWLGFFGSLRGSAHGPATS